MSSKGKIFTLLLVIVFLISLVSIQPATVKAQSKTIVVPDDFPTIQTAVDNAFAGQTVFVRTGVYYEQHITIDKPLSLVGENPENTILVGINYEKYSPPYVIQISADNVKVSGFTIMNGSLGGIRVETVGSVTQPTGCVISGNNIVKNYNDGISTYDGKALTISNNNISNNSLYGIYDSSSQSVISNNYVAENGAFGVIVDSCNDVSINHNIIEQNGYLQNNGEQGGVCLRWFGNFNVYSNSITNNHGDGVQFSEGCSNSLVYDNNITGNNVGVNLFNFAITNNSENIGIGLDNQVYRNNLINHQNAFVQTAFAYGNISNIYYAIGNGTDVISWDNGKVGNYWSDYNGQGAYVIDKNNTDNYPLTQQVDVSVTISTPTPFQPNIVLILPIVLTAAILTVALSILLYRRHRKNSSLSK